MKKENSDKRLYPIKQGSLIYYDSDWQFPAITEKHAFLMAKKLLPNVSGLIYFAFPWATYFDYIDRSRPEASYLKEVLVESMNLIKPGDIVITVCQHILMLKHSRIFAELGISTVFWSHATKDQSYIPNFANIQIKPFPLFPVQVLSKISTTAPRQFLFSFVGARSNQWYLTQSRNLIIDTLSSSTEGKVISRDQWHYNKVVYDLQITKKSTEDSSVLINNNNSEEFVSLLVDSIFSLCPSGSGPNSIRLWESIGAGSIPVILADTYLPPGNIDLWKNSAIFIDENLESIKEIPDILRAISQDSDRLNAMRTCLHQLWSMYGPECFIYDIKKMFVEHSYKEALAEINRYDLSFMSISREARNLSIEKSASNYDLSRFNSFGLRCIILAFKDPSSFSKFLEKDSTVNKLLGDVFSNELFKYYKVFDSVLKMRGLDFKTSK